MNTGKVIEELQQKYPGKKIVLNDTSNPTEIICEIESPQKDGEHSIAIAVIDQSIPHFHVKSTEEYTVLKGKLLPVVDGKEYVLSEGQKYVITQGQHHFAKGDETWIACKTTPGWTPDDHILIR